MKVESKYNGFHYRERNLMCHLQLGQLFCIGSNVAPSWCQAIIWTNAEILLIRTLGTELSVILIGIHISSFKKKHLNWSPAKWRPFCLGLSVLTLNAWVRIISDELGQYDAPTWYNKIIRGRSSLQWRHNGCDGVSNHQLHTIVFWTVYPGADQRKHQSWPL